jgi:uncharacterized protein (UPF0332 family)
MQWSGFQHTAERLSLGATEGDWRSAISRGYYAVFHYFRAFLLAQGLDVGRGGQSHFNLYSGLLNCGYPAVAAIASRIDRLRELRVYADYDLGRQFQQLNATGAVQEMQAAITDFQTILTTLSPRLIADGARRYLQAIGHLGRTP